MTCTHHVPKETGRLLPQRAMYFKWEVNIYQTSIWATTDLCLSSLRATGIFYSNYRKPMNVPGFKRFPITFSIAQRFLPIMALPLALHSDCSRYHWAALLCSGREPSAWQHVAQAGLACPPFSSQMCIKFTTQWQLFFQSNQKEKCPEQISKHLKK